MPSRLARPRDLLQPVVLQKISFLILLNLAVQAQTSIVKPWPVEPPVQEEHWYIIRIGGTEVGYVQEKLGRIFPAEKPTELERILTETKMRLILNRLGSRVELFSSSSAKEDAAGRLLTTRFEMKLSSQVTTMEAMVHQGTIELRSEAGGKSYVRSIAYQGELFGPEGIRAMSSGQLKKIGDRVSAQTFVAEASLVTRLSRTLKARETIERLGRKVCALRVEEILEGIAVRRTLWLDDTGMILKQEEPGPFGLIEISLTDRATALAFLAKGQWPVEIYAKSIIRSNIRLPRAKPLERLKVKLVHHQPTLGWPELGRSNQAILEKTEKTMTLEIRRPTRPEKTSFPVPIIERNRPYLEPNAYLQSDDPEIKRLAHELVATEKDAFAAALILERWVAENLTFDLGLVFAPASEIFRDRRGTCLGYATLLATMARAVGIPARVVLGYVHALGMFGGHAWAEVLVGETWVPLDAAIVNEGPADATRIAILDSSLVQGPGELALGAAQQVFGQVDIEILEYEIDGKTCKVLEGAKAYAIEGNHYDNPWLGISLEKPNSFRFSMLEAVWPDRVLLAMDGPAGERVFLEQDIIYPWQEGIEEAQKKLADLVPGGRTLSIEIDGGRYAPATACGDGAKAALALSRGSEILILRVEAKEGLKLLLDLVRSLHFQD